MVIVVIGDAVYLVTYHGMSALSAWDEAHREFDPFYFYHDAGVAYRQ